MARCFRSEPENLGAGDYKIWYTSEISSDSVGRGWTVPANLISQPIVEAINELSSRLGYLPVFPEAWGVGAPPPDVRLPMAGGAPGRIQRPVGPGTGGGETALVAGALRERIGAALGDRSLIAAGQRARTADAFRLAVFPDESQSRIERPALIAVDPSEGAAEIIDPFATDAGRPLSQSWELLGSAGTWRRVLDGEVNLGVALRRNELRYRPEAAAGEARDESGATGSEPIEAGLPIMRTEVHRRMTMVSQLLGATCWQPG